MNQNSGFEGKGKKAGSKGRTRVNTRPIRGGSLKDFEEELDADFTPENDPNAATTLIPIQKTKPIKPEDPWEKLTPQNEYLKRKAAERLLVEQEGLSETISRPTTEIEDTTLIETRSISEAEKNRKLFFKRVEELKRQGHSKDEAIEIAKDEQEELLIKTRVEEPKKEKELEGLEPKNPTVETPAVEPEPVPEPVTSPIPEVKIQPETKEEKEAKKEFEKLPEEEKGKIGWGIGVIGLKIEKAKNDLFANTLSLALKKIDGKSTTGKFFKELASSFKEDAKKAEQKAKEVTSGKANHLLAKVSGWGNILKYGRLITDVTGATAASSLRYVTMGGMAVSKLSETGKSVRLKNEDVLEKTRIQDIEKAYDEAIAIYTDAQKEAKNKDKDGNVTPEELKKAYMMRIPKNLAERLQRPSTADGLIQYIMRKDISQGVENLNKKIEKIENNAKFSKEQKKQKIEKLLLEQKDRLRDYDRILSQYGTVDELAMWGRYGQITGKTLVAVTTIETLTISAEKLWDSVSHIFSKSHELHAVLPTSADTVQHHAPVTPAATASHEAVTHAPHGVKIAESIHAPIPENTHVINNLANEGIKFEHGKGGIQGILDLKKQIIAQYHGDYSKAPASVQQFMNTDATKEAIKLGLYDPNNLEESASIRAGSILKFDEHGNLIFHDAKTGEDVTHYAGKMFDSDGSVRVPKIPTEHITAPQEEAPFDKGMPSRAEPISEHQNLPQESFRDGENRLHETNKSIIHTGDHHETAEDLKSKIVEHMDRSTPDHIVTSRGQGGENYIFNSNPNGVYAEDLYGGGKVITSRGEGGVNYVYNSGGNYPKPFSWGFSRHAEQLFKELSPDQNRILITHAEFGDNPFNLKGADLIRAYNTHQDNIKLLFGEHTEHWRDMRNLKVGALLSNDSEYKNDPLVDYIKRLKEISGLKPKSGFLGLGPEKTESYIARAIQKVTEEGRLEKIKIIKSN